MTYYKNNNLFAARILYIMDVRIQNFSGQHNRIIAMPPRLTSPACLKIVDNCTFKVHLPNCILKCKSKCNSDDSNRDQKVLEEK